MDGVLGKGPITHEKIEQLRWVLWKEVRRKVVWGQGLHVLDLMPSLHWDRIRHPRATLFFFLEVIKPQDDLQHRQNLP